MDIAKKYEDVVAERDAAIHRENLSDKHIVEGLEREAALREELDNHDCATLLINAWVDAHGKQIPWDKAIEIIAVATKMPDAEKTRLLCLEDQYELLQQRLTVAEQRSAELESAAREMLRIAAIANQGSNAYNRAIINLHSALKPAAEGEGS